MLRIAISPVELSDERREATAVSILLEEGWSRVHLRHPGASLKEMQRLIEAIPQRFHGSLVLHGHFDLTNYFNLGGLHLNHRCPAPPPLYRGKLSKSCHSIEELHGCAGFDYATLSPIFDSISKQGYRSNFSPSDLRGLDSVTVPVIALGGVTPDNIGSLKDFNFSGFAMLGAIPWDGSGEELTAFTGKNKNA